MVKVVAKRLIAIALICLFLLSFAPMAMASVTPVEYYTFSGGGGLLTCIQNSKTAGYLATFGGITAADQSLRIDNMQIQGGIYTDLGTVPFSLQPLNNTIRIYDNGRKFKGQSRMFALSVGPTPVTAYGYILSKSGGKIPAYQTPLVSQSNGTQDLDLFCPPKPNNNQQQQSVQVPKQTWNQVMQLVTELYKALSESPPQVPAVPGWNPFGDWSRQP